MKKVNKARKITENDIRNLHYIHENEGLIPDGVTKLEDEDITSAEVITESKKSKVNESNNITSWVSKRNPGNVKDEANNVLRMLGYRIDPSQTELEEIIKHFHEDYNGDKDYEEYTVMLLGYYYLMFGYTEFYNDYASKYDVTVDEYGVLTGVNEYYSSTAITNSRFWEFMEKFKNFVGGEDSILYKELSYKILTMKEDFNTKKAAIIAKEFLTEKGLWDQFSSDIEAIPINEDNIDDSMEEFRKLTDSDVWKKFRGDWKGTDVYDVAMDAISYVDTLPQMINMLKKVLTEYDMLIDYETELDKLLKQQSVNEGRLEDFMNINSINPNIVDDKEAFEDKIQHFINCDGDYKFHEDILLMLNAYKKKYGETDFYHNLVNQGYSLDDLKHEGRLRFFCQKYLKKNGFDVSVLNNQSSLKDSIQNMDNNNKDYTQICALLNYYKEHYGMDDFVRSLTDENNNDPFGDAHYYDIDSYGKFETINEYKTVGVYKTNDGDVEDLYYIQAGDIILINHKDYGELQCKVKKVDADKNKVYFVTIERGIMGVCGFDKIHGIELVDECQKQPVFVQTKYITFPEGGMCYMCYSKVDNRFIDVYCTFGMSLDNCECIKLLNMTEDEFSIIDNIMVESDIFEEAKTKVYNSGLMSL